MKVLVTGASGFLGRTLVERLLAHGETEIRCFVRPSSNFATLAQLQRSYPKARLDYVIGNLASRADARRAVEGIETIYHLAAGMKGLPATLFFNTLVASQSLIDAMKDKKRRVVLVSSIGVYDTSSLGTKHLVGEDTDLDPHPEKRSVYFHAKIWQEHLFREQAENGHIDLVVVRPGVLYGDGNPNRGFPSRIGVLVGHLLFVFGGKQVLPLCHVVNCAEAVILAGTSPNASGHSYNVLDDNLPTVKDYLRQHKREVENVSSLCFPFPAAMLLSKIVERYHRKTHGQIPAVLTPYETKAMWKGHRFDNQSIKKLGWKRIVPMDEGLRETFAYLRASMNGGFGNTM